MKDERTKGGKELEGSSRTCTLCATTKGSTFFHEKNY
jgi:hypothetical protein